MATAPSQTPAPASEEEVLVCFCHGVTPEEILKAIGQGARTLEAIRKQTRASTGCGGCTSEVERLLAEALAKAVAKG